MENGFQGSVAESGRCGVGSGDGLAGRAGGDGVWGGGKVGGVDSVPLGYLISSPCGNHYSKEYFVTTRL